MVVLKVLSLNIWGLHYIATRVNERVQLIAEELKGYDIIGLQEVWSKKDYGYLVKELKDSLPYAHYFHNGIIGSGLCVFSRYPILTAYSHPFTATDEILHFRTGDIFGGKGVMAAKIRTPQGVVMFYNTHTNFPHQNCHLFEILQFVEGTRGADPVILVGDFNTNPHHLAYSLITRCLRLRDIYMEKFCERPYHKPRRSKETTIDFIFISDELSRSCSLTVQDCHVTMSEEVPGRGCHLSDHDGVEATLELCREENRIPSPQGNAAEALNVYDKVLARMEEKRKQKLTTHHRVIFRWILYLLLNVALIIFFSIPSISAFFSSCYLHWLIPTLGVVAGALTMFFVMHSFTTIQLLSALEKNIKEIKLIKQNLY